MGQTCKCRYDKNGYISIDMNTEAMGSFFTWNRLQLLFMKWCMPKMTKDLVNTGGMELKV